MKKSLGQLGLISLLIMLSCGQFARADLVAYWPLNDGADGDAVTGADDVIDAGTFYQDAVVQGTGGTWFDDPARGIVFSTGEDDRLNLGTQGIDRNNGFTWSFWGNIASSNIADPGADVIIGTRGGNPWHKIDVQSISNWAGINYPTGSSFLADDTWHHHAYVGDATSVRFYRDGVLVGEDFTTSSMTYNGNFELGGSSQFSEDITGLLSEVAVWDHALGEARIQELAAGGSVVIPEPSSLLLFGLGMVLIFRVRVSR